MAKVEIDPAEIWNGEVFRIKVDSVKGFQEKTKYKGHLVRGKDKNILGGEKRDSQ